MGIVGCGRKASTIDDERKCPANYCRPPCSHAGAYAALPQTQVVAACAPSGESRRAFAQRWGLPFAALYTDYRDMLAATPLDVVSVCTHADLHAAVTIAAAEAGVRGVLCEKAMATSLAEADAMLAACARSGTRLLVNHPRRFHPTYTLVRQALCAGAIGELRTMLATVGGAIVHNGTHLFDLVRYFGGEVQTVAARLGPSPGGDGDGHCHLALRSGVTAFLSLAGQLPFSFELLGTEGRILIDSSREGADLWRYGQPGVPPSVPLAEPSALAGAALARPVDDQAAGQPKRDLRSAEPRRWYHGNPCRPRWQRHLVPQSVESSMVAAIVELLAAIEEAREPESSGHDGRAALEIALACHASQRAGGAPVSLPLEDRDLRVLSR